MAASNEFSDVNVQAEAGQVSMTFRHKVTGTPFKVVVSQKEAKRIAGALTICASAPAGVDVVNFDMRTD